VVDDTNNTNTNDTFSATPSSINATDSIDCSRPCPPGGIGFYTWPGTQCSKYVQCEDGSIVMEFDCPDGTMFFEETGVCRTVNESGEGDDLYALQGTE
jgi:hypothetical protein